LRLLFMPLPLQHMRAANVPAFLTRRRFCNAQTHTFMQPIGVLFLALGSSKP